MLNREFILWGTEAKMMDLFLQKLHIKIPKTKTNFSVLKFFFDFLKKFYYYIMS